MSVTADPVHEASTFAQMARRGGRALLDVMFPPLCITCHRPVAEPHNLCAMCWNEVSFLEGPECAQCGLPFDIDPGSETLCAARHASPPAFDRARAVMRYDEASKAPLLALKRADRLDIVPAFARWLERSGRSLLAETDLIVPVPLHRVRLWHRRFNQAALLAGSLARARGLPFDPLALVRTRPTKSQGAMPSAKARRRNVRGAFRVSPARESTVQDRTVLLVDDVFTTGATLDACAKALKKAGAARVLALTLARVVRPPATTI
jgi:ComF family protein